MIKKCLQYNVYLRVPGDFHFHFIAVVSFTGTNSIGEAERNIIQFNFLAIASFNLEVHLYLKRTAAWHCNHIPRQLGTTSRRR